MRVTLGKKLGFGFGTILFLMALSALLTYEKSAQIRQMQDAILEVRVPSLEAGRRLQRDLNQTASKTRQAILAGTQPTRKEEAQKLLDLAWSEVDKDIQRLDELSPGWILQENRDRLAEVKKQVPVLHEIEETSIKLASSGDHDALVKGGNEISELAKETAKATEDISRKIEAIQTDTKAAVDAIANISGVINQINDISNTIATAVEEQNATTNEMARNVSEAAHSSGEITSNIAGMAQAAESTSRGASDTQKAAHKLVETSAELRRVVEQFKIRKHTDDQAVTVAPSRKSTAVHAGA